MVDPKMTAAGATIFHKLGWNWGAAFTCST
jgi:hypothetical protein